MAKQQNLSILVKPDADNSALSLKILQRYDANNPAVQNVVAPYVQWWASDNASNKNELDLPIVSGSSTASENGQLEMNTNITLPVLSLDKLYYVKVVSAKGSTDSGASARANVFLPSPLEPAPLDNLCISEDDNELVLSFSSLDSRTSHIDFDIYINETDGTSRLASNPSKTQLGLSDADYKLQKDWPTASPYSMSAEQKAKKELKIDLYKLVTLDAAQYRDDGSGASLPTSGTAYDEAPEFFVTYDVSGNQVVSRKNNAGAWTTMQKDASGSAASASTFGKVDVSGNQGSSVIKIYTGYALETNMSISAHTEAIKNDSCETSNISSADFIISDGPNKPPAPTVDSNDSNKLTMTVKAVMPADEASSLESVKIYMQMKHTEGPPGTLVATLPRNADGSRSYSVEIAQPMNGHQADYRCSYVAASGKESQLSDATTADANTFDLKKQNMLLSAELAENDQSSTSVAKPSTHHQLNLSLACGISSSQTRKIAVSEFQIVQSSKDWDFSHYLDGNGVVQAVGSDNVEIPADGELNLTVFIAKDADDGSGKKLNSNVWTSYKVKCGGTFVPALTDSTSIANADIDISILDGVYVQPNNTAAPILEPYKNAIEVRGVAGPATPPRASSNSNPNNSTDRFFFELYRGNESGSINPLNLISTHETLSGEERHIFTGLEESRGYTVRSFAVGVSGLTSDVDASGTATTQTIGDAEQVLILDNSSISVRTDSSGGNTDVMTLEVEVTLEAQPADLTIESIKLYQVQENGEVDNTAMETVSVTKTQSQRGASFIMHGTLDTGASYVENGLFSFALQAENSSSNKKHPFLFSTIASPQKPVVANLTVTKIGDAIAGVRNEQSRVTVDITGFGGAAEAQLVAIPADASGGVNSEQPIEDIVFEMAKGALVGGNNDHKYQYIADVPYKIHQNSTKFNCYVIASNTAGMTSKNMFV